MIVNFEKGENKRTQNYVNIIKVTTFENKTKKKKARDENNLA